MYNWSTNIERLKKNPQEYAIWKLEQQINFGLGKDKLNKKKLIKYWNKIVIDPAKRTYLKFLLYDKKPTD